jgi:hypothetical protein
MVHEVYVIIGVKLETVVRIGALWKAVHTDLHWEC